MQHLTGREFDKEFVGLMMSDHEKNISEFTEKADEGDRQVPELAKKSLPMLQKHLQLAQSLNGALNASK